MRIRIRLFADLRETFQATEMTISAAEGTTIRQALEAICDSSAKRRAIFDKDELKQYMIVLRNGRHIQHLDGLDTVLREKDELAVFPPVAGG